MKKRIIPVLLVLWLGAVGSRAQGINTPVCLAVLVTAAAAGAALVVITVCRPSYRCLSDPEVPGTNWCSTMARSAAASSGLVAGEQNFKSFKTCMALCVNTNSLGPPRRDLERDFEVYKSTDLVTWTVLPYDGEVNETGSLVYRDLAPAGQMQCFYWVRDEAPGPEPKPAQPSVQGAKFKLLTAPAPAN